MLLHVYYSSSEIDIYIYTDTTCFTMCSVTLIFTRMVCKCTFVSLLSLGLRLGNRVPVQLYTCIHLYLTCYIYIYIYISNAIPVDWFDLSTRSGVNCFCLVVNRSGVGLCLILCVGCVRWVFGSVYMFPISADYVLLFVLYVIASIICICSADDFTGHPLALVVHIFNLVSFT